MTPYEVNEVHDVRMCGVPNEVSKRERRANSRGLGAELGQAFSPESIPSKVKGPRANEFG